MPTEVAGREGVRDAEEARRFVAELGRAMAALREVLDEETTHLSAGRIGEGLSRESEKSTLSALYLRGLERLKSNAVALARFAPDGLRELKASHGEFVQAVGRNQAVIATAKAVSEGLIRTLSEEMTRQVRPTTYGRPAARAGNGRPESARPLLFSGRL